MQQWSIVLQNLTGLKLVQQLPAFYGIWRFIPAITSARQLPRSSASSIRSISRTILLLSSHLCLSLPSGLFPSSRTTFIHLSCLPYAPHATSYYSSFYHPNNIWWGMQIIKFLLIWIKVDQLWWHLLYYVNSLLSMFRVLIHQSSGACDYLVRYCVGCIVLTWGVLVLCSGIGCWWCGIRVQAEPLVLTQ